MLTLLYFSWVYTLGAVRPSQFFSSISSAYSSKNAALENITDFSASVQPVAAAVSSSRSTFAAKYGDRELTDIYSRIENRLAEAIGSAKATENITAADFNAVLSGKIVYLEYENNIPLFLIGSWHDIEPSEQMYDVFSDFVILSADNDQITLYCHSQGNDFLKITTTVKSNTLEAVFASYSTENAAFAIFCGDEYRSLRPETLVLSSEPTVFELAGQSPAIRNNSDETEFLFSAFKYDPYTVRKYEENDGTIVYVDNLSTLNITRNGILHFNAPEKQGIEIYDYSEYMPQTEKLKMAVEASYSLVAEAFRGIDSSAVLRLNGVYTDDNSYTVSFVRMADGIPIYSSDGYSTAYVKIKDNLILSAYINLRCYRSDGHSVPILPIKQAIAALSVGEDNICRLCIYYADNPNEGVRADWYARETTSSFQAAIITEDGAQIEMEQN